MSLGAYAQTETTQWYIDTELYATTSCESGADVNVPSDPHKKGYTFLGWQPAVYDMSTLDAAIDGSVVYFSGKKWHVTFDYGDVYGEKLCSPTSVYEPSINLDTSDTGSFCYCRITAFIPTGSRIIYEPLFSSWVYFPADSVYQTQTNCRSYCLSFCANNFMKNTRDFRRKLYGIN